MLEPKLPSPLHKITPFGVGDHIPEIWIKRDDLIHPEISGNKWRKLKGYLDYAQTNGAVAIITFGGAYSNHIAATAAAAKNVGIKSVGIIRGEEADLTNSTLSFAHKQGMNIVRVSREAYKRKTEEGFVRGLGLEERSVIINEGGYGKLGLIGCSEIVTELPFDFDYIMTPCGTGTTLAGIITALQNNQTAIGVSALKGGEFLKDEVEKLLPEEISFNNAMLLTNYHFGGYAKVKPELVNFMESFKNKTGVQLDYVYTGKMLFALSDLIDKNTFTNSDRIVVVHTGGIQGNVGMEQKLKLRPS